MQNYSEGIFIRCTSNFLIPVFQKNQLNSIFLTYSQPDTFNVKIFHLTKTIQIQNYFQNTSDDLHYRSSRILSKSFTFPICLQAFVSYTLPTDTDVHVLFYLHEVRKSKYKRSNFREYTVVNLRGSWENHSFSRIFEVQSNRSDVFFLQTFVLATTVPQRAKFIKRTCILMQNASQQLNRNYFKMSRLGLLSVFISEQFVRDRGFSRSVRSNSRHRKRNSNLVCRCVKFKRLLHSICSVK